MRVQQKMSFAQTPSSKLYVLYGHLSSRSFFLTMLFSDQPSCRLADSAMPSSDFGGQQVLHKSKVKIWGSNRNLG